MKLISVTMKLFFWEKFHCDLKGWKTCRFKSLRFDFCVINFDTMKFILIAKVLKILVQSHFWQKKKRNASIVSILAFQYGGGGGSWTPVRKHFNGTFSGRRRLFRESASLFPFRSASRHAGRSGESHDAWAGQLFPASRTPHQRRLPRPVASPVQTAAFN